MTDEVRKLGKYHLLGEVGHGATGAVHRARDSATGRTVALKTIPLARLSAGDRADAALDRFRRDCRAAARLAHPNIVTILASGEHGGTAFIAMEWVDARPLDRVLDSGERTPPERSLSILAQVLSALDHAHRHGAVHGTLGTADVLIDAAGAVKVTGFGSGGLVNPDAGVADDLRAAGTILAALTQGREPSAAEAALLFRATADRPEERFATAAAFAQAAASLQERPAPAVLRSPRRTRAPLIALPLLLAAVLGGAALWYGAPAGSPPAPPPPAPPPSVAQAPPPKPLPQSPSPQSPSPEQPPEPPPEPPPADVETASQPEPVEAAPLPVPALEPLRADLRALRCAVLDVAEDQDGRLLVTGTVTSESIRPQVQALIDRHAAGWPRRVDLRVAAPALCDPLALVEAQRAANAAAPAPLSIRLVSPEGEAVLHGGQELVFEVTAPDVPVHVQVDYYTADGSVVHLLPNPLETSGRIEAGAVRRLGDRAGGGRFWTIGPPFGNELIVVLASPAPLFSSPRPEAELASAYLPELKRALDAAEAPALAAARFIATEPP